MSAWKDESPEEPLEEREYPDETDWSLEEYDEAIVPCPQCGAPVHEDAGQCPHCRQWIVDGPDTWRPRGRWYYRTGRWLLKVLTINWLIGIGMMVLTALAVLIALWRR